MSFNVGKDLLPVNALELVAPPLAHHEAAAPGRVDVQPDTVARADVWGEGIDIDIP